LIDEPKNYFSVLRVLRTEPKKFSDFLVQS